MSEEQKAYDLKRLAEIAKEEGLEVAEEAAESLYKAVRTWFVESAALSKNPFDDMVVPFLTQVDGVVLDKIDDINPHDNEDEAASE